VRDATAQAVRRAGMALQLAIDLAHQDDTYPDTGRADLDRLRPLAVRLADVPVMPPEVRQLVDHGEWSECAGCGHVRPTVALGGPGCPACGHHQDPPAPVSPGLQ
jgi:hypothetical protein